jgi:hypothetical protein
MPRLIPEIFTTVDSVTVIELRNVVEELPIIPRLFFPRDETAVPENRYDVLSPQQNVFVAENVREINTAYRNHRGAARAKSAWEYLADWLQRRASL